VGEQEKQARGVTVILGNAQSRSERPQFEAAGKLAKESRETPETIDFASSAALMQHKPKKQPHMS
jgi:hypothetical protein